MDGYYQMPKALIYQERYKGLSTEAKVLYCFMLDRRSLSAKNGWKDERGRTYIYFTVEEAMELLRCHSQKVTKLMKELEDEMVALIFRKNKGQGRPSIIYVDLPVTV